MGRLTSGTHPDFRLIANSRDVTETIRAHFVRLDYSDEAGLESDTLEIQLDDTDTENPIQLPAMGAELELFIGYAGNLQRIGLFIVDEITLAGWPATISIGASAAVFEKSKGGKNTLQSQKRRSWPRNTKLGDLVSKIAKEHGLTAAVDNSLKQIALPHIDQTEESDLNLLVRLAKKYDAAVKPTDGKLVFAKRGQGTSVGGKALPSLTIHPEDVSDYSVKRDRRDAAGSVVATWRETRKAKRHVVKVGDGEPATRLRKAFTSEAEARAAAQAEMTKSARAAATLSFRCIGDPQLLAEVPLELAGFREGVSGRWIIKSVKGSLDTSGYTCTVDAEIPNPTGMAPVSNG